MLYRYTEEGQDPDLTFEAAREATAIHVAKGLLRSGEWGEITKTIRLYADIYPISETPGERIYGDPIHVEIELDPDEPSCTQGEHDWISGQSYGSDHGGVISTDECSHCGLQRTTDTGGTNRSDGTRLETVQYAEVEDYTEAESGLCPYCEDQYTDGVEWVECVHCGDTGEAVTP